MNCEVPAPDEVRAARKAAGLTQTAAADLVCAKLRTWQCWEAGDRHMPAGMWQLFTILTTGLPREV